MPEIQTITSGTGGIEQHEKPPATASSIRIKTPRRILHFSDGTMEEYSTDDETDAPASTNPTNQQNQIDIARLNWGPWMIHQAHSTSTRVLSACDFVGEKVAAFLGITTPKYEYEIEQFKKMQKEREKAQKEEVETGGWMQATNDSQRKPNTISDGVQYVITQESLKEKF